MSGMFSTTSLGERQFTACPRCGHKLAEIVHVIGDDRDFMYYATQCPEIPGGCGQLHPTDPPPGELRQGQ